METILLGIAVISIIITKKWINAASVLLMLWAIIIKLSKLRLFGLYSTDEKIYYFIFVGLISFFIGFALPRSKTRLVIKRKQLSSYNKDFEKEGLFRSLNYEVCYLSLIICILITLLKLKDLGFDFSNITLFGELNRSYNSQFVNMLYEFIAYPLYNTFICVTVADYFFGTKDKWLIILTTIMILSWTLISGGRIAIIRLMIAVIICMSLKTTTKHYLAKYFSSTKLILIIMVACLIFVYFTLLKGFEPLFNLYTSFAIQPIMFEYWSEKITNQYAYGAASLFGFLYPFLYVIKNALGLTNLPLGALVYENIANTFNQWITLGTAYYCNAYTSSFWYLYYDGRMVGIILGMFLWGRVCRNVFRKTLKILDIRNISIYILIMIGVIYSFTDMEFSKANYVLAFLFISKMCFCKYKIKFMRTGGK